jgi:methionyl-tRNA formyltransferase
LAPRRSGLRTVFLGTSDFAAAVLERLAASAHSPALVVTRPDRPRGRGRKVASPPVAEAARALTLPVAQPERVNDPEVCAFIGRLDSTVDAASGGGAEGQRAGSAEELQTGLGPWAGSEEPRAGSAEELQTGSGPQASSAGPRADCTELRRAGGGETVLVVCAFGALIREPLLSAHPLLNVHPSLLPRWRGAAPIERAIMAGDAHTGVSIMSLTEGLDSGPVCAASSEAIAPDDTYGSLAERLQRLAGELLVGVLDGWERGELPRFDEQPEEGVTYAEKLGAEDRLLDPRRTPVELGRQVRALHPHIGARLALADGTLLGVSRAAPAQAGTPSPPAGALAADGGHLLYGTGAGALELLEVRPPGGRPMDAGAYLRGHHVPEA